MTAPPTTGGFAALRPRFSSAGRASARAFFGLTLPATCTRCGKPGEPPVARLTPACACLDDVAPHRGPWCAKCGAPLGPHLDGTDGCVHCGQDRFAFGATFSLGTHAGELRDAIHVAKSDGGRVATCQLTEDLVDRRGGDLRAFGADRVVPVPHHWFRRLSAGHQAADEVGRTLARALSVRFGRNTLRARGRVRRQATLSPSERRANLRDTFDVSRRGRAELAGRRVLLADDVLTTGTTADRCAARLREAGAAAVAVAVLARGLGR